MPYPDFVLPDDDELDRTDRLSAAVFAGTLKAGLVLLGIWFVLRLFIG